MTPSFLFPLGIRHHGPGSARALCNRLSEIQPDCILIEGPPEGDALVHWLNDAAMQPPIALLVFQPDQPNKSTFFPYAEFSPEYQALRYGLAHDCTVRFFDLPQRNMMAAGAAPELPDRMVFEQIAQSAGFASYEQWWHTLVEQRQSDTAVFDAILELMSALRAEAVSADEADVPETRQLSRRVAAQREAFMRSCIREAHDAGFSRIAAVCGAWHAPALLDLDDAAADRALLAEMPTVETDAAWVPWSYGRLAIKSGYGAGIRSPGWYHHLWQASGTGLTPAKIASRWLAQVAKLLRSEDLDASPAHVIEAVRLAETLAALRQRPYPGLEELNEASLTILCEGSDAPMQLINDRLIVSDRMGVIPPSTPMVPLQRDIYIQQQTLRLPQEAERRRYTLDLRQPLDLARSQFLHRLQLLNIAWGHPIPARGRQGGRSQEMWTLTWEPRMTIQVVEAAMWGNTVESAAQNSARDRADKAQELTALTTLLDQIILAELPETVLYLMERIESVAAVSSDVPLMMDALIPLARVYRYGSVRQIDQEVVRHVIDGLVTRICIGLPTTSQMLDDEAASHLAKQITAVHATINSLQIEAHQEKWEQALRKIVDQEKVPGLVGGKACRLLLDNRAFSAEDAAVRMARTLSLQTAVYATSEQLTQIAAWVDGFLQGSGLLVLHDQLLWQLLDNFVSGLEKERFHTVLPLLRRTFSSFSDATREQIDRRVRHGQLIPTEDAQIVVGFDQTQAEAILPTLTSLLGIKDKNEK